MSLQVGEMPDSNPGLQVVQSGALPLSHHIPKSHLIPIVGHVVLLFVKGVQDREYDGVGGVIPTG